MGTGWGPQVIPGGGGGLTPPGNTPSPDETKGFYNEVTGIAALTLTDVLTWVVPTSPTIHLLMIEFGGCNIADYFLEIGGTQAAKGITYFGGKMTGVWDFRNQTGGKPLAGASTLKVKVEHCRPDLGDFFARICYMEIN